jgi:hypothetical protein
VAARDEESAFPDFPEGLVKPQKDSVVAFMDGPDQVEAAMEELVGQGFDGRHHGLRGRIYRLVEWMSDEKGILFRARDHLAAGGLVLSVPADEDQKASAARILGGHGGHGMAHFGQDHWEPLGS